MNQEAFDTAYTKLQCSLDNGWQHRKETTTEFAIKKANEYAEKLNLDMGDVFFAIENRRDYSAPNYYQEANFPTLSDDVVVYDTESAARDDINYSLGFICPFCGGISKNPNECDTGKLIRNNKKEPCNWKSYGLFGTLGKGYRLIIKDTFLAKPIVYEIFMPVSKASKKRSK